MIPPDANAAFVAAMEDVLEVYTRPHDPDFPVVCLDETSKQLIAETRVPIPVKPGHPARHDYEYERNGTANLFMMFAPLEGSARQGHRPSYRPGLCSGPKGIVRHALPRRKENLPGAGQSQYSQTGVTLRSLSRRRSTPAGRKVRVALYA